jgi:hypothetical protein
MDRHIVIASIVALALASVAKVLPPQEITVTTGIVKTHIETVAPTQPDPLWLVGP